MTQALTGVPPLRCLAQILLVQDVHIRLYRLPEC